MPDPLARIRLKPAPKPPAPVSQVGGQPPAAPPIPGRLEPEFAQPWAEWTRTKAPEHADAFLAAVSPVINEGLRSYGGASADSPTLRAHAKRLTLEAAEAYDPSISKLRTHLLSRLQGLRRIAAKSEAGIRVPEQSLLDLRRLRQAESHLSDELMRDPSDSELADHMGVPIKRIAELRKVPSAVPYSAAVRTDEDGNPIGPRVVASNQTKSLRDAWGTFVYHDLQPTDQLILEHTLGLHGKPVLSNQEIARKLRVSPGAVSQRRAKIQQRLDEFELTGLGG